MRKSLLIALTLILAFNLIDAKEVVQLTDDNTPHYKISVTHGGEPMGEMEIELFPEIAPKHCHNFDSLVAIQFYDGTAFHRVIPAFMIQGGDPNSKDKPKSTWGYGDPSQTKVPAEFSSKSHQRGILSAARANDPNSATSQFFICIAPSTYLDGKYSVYGQVVTGMDIADKIVNVARDSKDNPLEKVEMSIIKLQTESVVDISLQKQPEITVFPNPGNDIIGFHSDNNDIFILSAKITGTDGRLYINETYSSAKNLNELKLSLASFPIGVYIINLRDSEGRVHFLRVVAE